MITQILGLVEKMVKILEAEIKVYLPGLVPLLLRFFSSYCSHCCDNRLFFFLNLPQTLAHRKIELEIKGFKHLRHLRRPSFRLSPFSHPRIGEGN